MIAAILLAGGQSSRMGPAVPDKVLARIGNRSVFEWSVEAFASSGVAEIIVVVHRDNTQRKALLPLISSCLETSEAIWTMGGEERCDSVRNALQSLPEETKAAFIHDCARPLIRSETLVSLREALSDHPAVALAHPVTDTLKFAEAKGNGAFATKSVDRQQLWAMETPQVFEFNLIQKAHAYAQENNIKITDDVSAVEALGQPVRLLETGYPNPKITTTNDLMLIEGLLTAAKETK